MMKSKVFFSIQLLAATFFAMMILACGGGESNQPAANKLAATPQATPTPPPPPPERGGKVSLTLDQETFQFEVEDMFHYRQAGSRADMFEIVCDRLRIVGKFPREFKPAEGTDENEYPWDSLVDQTVKVYDQTSIGKTELSLEGFDELKLIEGSLVIDHWKEVGGKPALYGRIRLQMETDSATNKVFAGPFKAIVNIGNQEQDDDGAENDFSSDVQSEENRTTE